MLPMGSRPGEAVVDVQRLQVLNQVGRPQPNKGWSNRQLRLLGSGLAIVPVMRLVPMTAVYLLALTSSLNSRSELGGGRPSSSSAGTGRER